jgi:hypothetical protein
MICRSCGLENETRLRCEMMVHRPNSNSLKPDVLTFPMLSACLHCGFTHFVLSEKELLLLSQAIPQERTA